MGERRMLQQDPCLSIAAAVMTGLQDSRGVASRRLPSLLRSVAVIETATPAASSWIATVDGNSTATRVEAAAARGAATASGRGGADARRSSTARQLAGRKAVAAGKRTLLPPYCPAFAQFSPFLTDNYYNQIYKRRAK